nr:hypothetical protein GCM10025699_62360 [Microbacterium flavescens]
MLADLGDDRGDEVVALHAAVAVLVLGHALDPRRDDEGRVRDDVVEGLAGHRLEEAAQPELDAVDQVERGVERGEVEGALRDVGGDHPAGVPRDVQGLDAAAGAEVERPVDLPRDHQAGEGRRGSADAEHVVLAEGAAERELAEVRGDPPADLAARVDERVGAEVDPGADG